MASDEEVRKDLDRAIEILRSPEMRLAYKHMEKKVDKDLLRLYAGDDHAPIDLRLDPRTTALPDIAVKVRVLRELRALARRLGPA